MKGECTLSESEIVKLCVVLIPSILFAVSAFVGLIIEEARKHNSTDLFKDKEALKLLRYMREEE